MAARLALLAAFICASAEDLECDSCTMDEFDANTEEKNKCCTEDVTSTTDRKAFWDKITGIFGLGAEYRSVKIRRSSKKDLLLGFCQNEKNTYKEDTVVFCGGCTDHLVSDPRAKAALLYGSEKKTRSSLQA